MIHLTEKDYAVSRWSGGTTTQIALFPPESSYAGRDFLWRVSSAVVEDGESAFTPLPDYDRHLMLLEGSLLLRHDGGEPLPLDPPMRFMVRRAAMSTCSPVRDRAFW